MRRTLLLALLALPSPAAADPCIDAAMPEMVAAAAGAASWLPAIDALRAARDGGCADPWIPVNLAVALRYRAEESADPAPACEAVEVLRAVIERGVPVEALPDARADLAVLGPLCEARRLRAEAVEKVSGEVACAAIEAYDAVASSNGAEARAPRVRVDIEDETAALRPLCAPRAAENTPAPPAARPWQLGARLGAGVAVPIDAPPAAVEVSTGPATAVALVGEWRRLAPWALRVGVGHAFGGLDVDDEASRLTGEVRWHAITVDLGVRRLLPARFDVIAALAVEFPFAATQHVGGTDLDALAALEPVVLVAQAGLGWTLPVAAPLRIEVTGALDLSARGAIGEAGGTLARVGVAVDYLFTLGAD
ncbi:MAG: hypothetical protein R3F65_32885 [bacterium]